MCSVNYLTDTKNNVADLFDYAHFELRRWDDVAAVCRVGGNLRPGLPGVIHSLPARIGANHQDNSRERDQHGGVGKAHQRENLSGLHQLNV